MQTSAPHDSASAPGAKEIPFGMNAMRLGPRHWLAVALLLLLALLAVPRVWQRVERFDTGPDYRVPYALSQDYWLWERWIERAAGPSNIVVLGDSVVWGEYVLPEGTLSHFLSRAAGGTGRFVNGGMNGLFPLALEGLTRYYGGAVRGRKVLLQCNPLWMTSAKADLQIQKEEKFNHSRLVPQFAPRIPCYRVDASERLSAVVERNLALGGWVNHLQHAYFGGKSILQWTLQDDGGDPPAYPNAYRNPLRQIALAVPGAPAEDPARGPGSSRHVPWTKNRPSSFEWVTPESSLQWAAFQRLVTLLRQQGNDVFVLVGPFNEHMVAPESRPGYVRLRDTQLAWLKQQAVPHVAPDPLPTELYADASHPLTHGYELLAEALCRQPSFRTWAGGGEAGRAR